MGEIMGDVTTDRKLGLKVGDWVMVRPAEEILATLDSNARLEELPFMPQMLQYCGKKLRVRKTAHKLCDTAFGTGGRQMNDAVFLDDIRCDGAAFGGCEMRCTIVWKEAWLRRADANEPDSISAPLESLDTLVRAGTRRTAPGQASGELLYVCQATQIPVATKLLPWWKPGQYIEDYRSGNVALSVIVGRLAFLLYSELVTAGIGLGSALKWIYNKVQAIRGGDPYPIRPGLIPLGGPTPTVNLGLKEGDLVRVKSADEILATVDEQLFNRGMSFHAEMMPFCGKTFRVSQRVQKIINERTGQLKQLKNSCLVLEGADCHGTCTRPLSCPRACPPYWREIWLERVDDGTRPSAQKEIAPQIGR